MLREAYCKNQLSWLQYAFFFILYVYFPFILHIIYNCVINIYFFTIIHSYPHYPQSYPHIIKIFICFLYIVAQLLFVYLYINLHLGNPHTTRLLSHFPRLYRITNKREWNTILHAKRGTAYAMPRYFLVILTFYLKYTVIH